MPKLPCNINKLIPFGPYEANLEEAGGRIALTLPSLNIIQLSALQTIGTLHYITGDSISTVDDSRYRKIYIVYEEYTSTDSEIQFIFTYF